LTERRSDGLRSYLMDNVMIHLTKSMLEVVRLPDAADKVHHLAALLEEQAEREEKRAEAAAYLRFEASVAKLRDLRQIEAEEDAREAEEEAARERGEVL